MATYLKGVKDYVPQLETFKPDYKFLSDVLTVRQDRYDTNYKSLNDLYGKVVYADMSREDNKAERDMYANQLSNGLKQVSGMDLSLAQNVDVAKGLFKPFFENKALVHDMTFTKMYQKKMQMANNFMTSGNEEVKERYWGDGVEDLKWQMDQYKTNDPNQAITQGMPNYVENPNLYKRSFEALKDSGLSIKQTTLEGDWIIETTNGTALTRQVAGYERNQDGSTKLDESKNPIPIYKNPAAEYLRETVMRDPTVINGYRVQARNRARTFANNPENIQKYGTVEAANQWWANDILKTQTNKDIEATAELNTLIKSGENAVSNWETYKKQHNIVPGTAEDEVYLKKMLELKIAKETKNFTEERIKNAKAPTSDMNQLMSKAYSQYMASVMGPLMSKAAVAYSQVDAEQTFEANPFKKMEHQHKYDLNKMAIRNSYDMNKIHTKAKYDKDLATYKNSLKSSEGAGAGIGGLGGMRSSEVNANITGDIMGDDFNSFDYNTETLNNFTNKIHNDKASWITDMLTSLPGSFQDVNWLSQSGSEMTYNIVNPETKEVTQKTASLSVAFQDLSLPENEAEFTRIYNNTRSKFEDITTTKSGARVYTQIPQLGLDQVAQGRLLEGFNRTYAAENQLNNAVKEMNKQYAQVYDWAIASDQVEVDSDVPLPLLTERQIAMAKDGFWSYDGKTYEVRDSDGNITKENIAKDYEQYNNTARRMLSKNEYIDMYVDIMKLPQYQRDQLTDESQSKRVDEYSTIRAGSYLDRAAKRDDFSFLSSDNYLIDTETTAENYWRYSPDPQIKDGSTGSWKFDEEKARAAAAKAYDGKDTKNDQGEWEEGAEGILGDMDAVIKNPKSGGENGLPGFNLNAYLIGQPYEGVGQTAFKQYTTTYDHYNKTPMALDQLNSTFQAVSTAPPGEVKFALGSDRTSEFFEESTLEKSNKAKELFNLMINDLNTQYGVKNDRAKRPVLTTSYVERMGGPDTKEDYAGINIVPGPDYGSKYKQFFGNEDADEADYQDFLQGGITIAVPEAYDNNPYKSINQVMSATDMIIQSDNEFTSEVVNGGAYSIYKNPDGGYVRQMQMYGFNETTGNIEPDPKYSTPLVLDKGALDQLVINSDAFLTDVSRANIAAQTNWKNKQTNK